MNVKSEIDLAARAIIATALKKIRSKTSVISEQNDALCDWKSLLTKSNYKPKQPLDLEFLFSLVEESKTAICNFADSKSKEIEEPLEAGLRRDDIAYQIRKAIEYHVSCTVARSCISTTTKILAVGAAASLLYAAYKIISSGESGESAISRAKEKEEEYEAKKATD